MKRFYLRFSYLGNNYRGSQKHSTDGIVDIDSIQGTLETSLWSINKYLKEPPKLILAGRTDAGVHALCMTAHVDIEHKSGITLFDEEHVLKYMNRQLISSNHDIRVFSCKEVSSDFHARFSAIARTYIYRFCIAKDLKDKRLPISEFGRTMYFHPQKFDIEKLKNGLKFFQGTRDYQTFTNKAVLSTHKNYRPDNIIRFTRTMNVSLHKSRALMPLDPLSDNFDFWHLVFTSKSFLYNQIRRITGTLLALGADKISEEDIITMLQVPSHDSWIKKIFPAQPHGLYLANVAYSDEEINYIDPTKS